MLTGLHDGANFAFKGHPVKEDVLAHLKQHLGAAAAGRLVHGFDLSLFFSLMAQPSRPLSDVAPSISSVVVFFLFMLFIEGGGQMLARRLGDGITHLAGAAIGDETHGIDALARGTGRHDDLAPALGRCAAQIRQHLQAADAGAGRGDPGLSRHCPLGVRVRHSRPE